MPDQPSRFVCFSAGPNLHPVATDVLLSYLSAWPVQSVMLNVPNSEK